MSAEMLDILYEDRRWKAAGLGEVAPRAAAAALEAAGLDPDAWEIALLACNDARIAALNADFRGRPTPTNVLSWPSEDRAAPAPGAAPRLPRPGDPTELGDLALAFETCTREAEAAGKPLADHAAHLVVHGVLHLLGYDHETEADAALMERIEIETLGNLGLPDPYSH